MDGAYGGVVCAGLGAAAYVIWDLQWSLIRQRVPCRSSILQPHTHDDSGGGLKIRTQ
jgi:hypothetical protein